MIRKLLLILMATIPAILTGAAPTDTLRIAHLCDPQLGFGKGGFDDDLEAFCREVDKVNETQPDIVLIAGDMVNVMDSTSIGAFLKAAAKFKAPVVYTPGNHDLPEPVTAAGLKRYTEAFGPDFSSHTVKGRTIISVNSMLMRSGLKGETKRHDAQLTDALEKAKAAASPMIILSHIPPFDKGIDEADEYFNLPGDSRKLMLERFYDAGCRLWLAGHTHTTAARSFGGIDILNGENTSRNFDGRPKGFRLLTIAPDGTYTWQFVPI